MNPKIGKLEKEIKNLESKISELQQRLQEKKDQKTELEDAEYISACRSYHLSPAELYEFLQSKRLPCEPEKAEADNEN